MARPVVKPADAPQHLSAEARELWRDLTAGWHLDADGRALLLQACESLDRLRDAQRIVKAEGLITVSVRGAKRAHPAIRVEQEARRSLLAALNVLHLEGEQMARKGTA
jgi:P27 family predicted phage terminase small subunit